MEAREGGMTCPEAHAEWSHLVSPSRHVPLGQTKGSLATSRFCLSLASAAYELQTNSLNSVSLSFLICTTEIIVIPNLKDFSRDWVKVYAKRLGQCPTYNKSPCSLRASLFLALF